MCGRYVLTQPADVLEEAFEISEEGRSAEIADGLAPRYNIAPTQEAPIVRVVEGRRTLSKARWGLVPYWAEDAVIGNRLINARSETASAKPAFRDALKRRRCLIPADGFYEWKPMGKTKQPYYFHPRERRVLGIAGLWDRWRDGPLTLESFTLLTTDANGAVAPVHDRMPVILEPGDFARWLDPEGNAEALQPLLRPCPDEVLDKVAVSTLVNDPANDDERCVEPVPTLFDL